MSRKKLYLRFFLFWVLLVVIGYLLIDRYFFIDDIYNAAIALTLATVLLFGLDKWQAIHRGVRVPEKVFFAVTLLGGSLGALIGMNVFRHKTSKTSFQFTVVLIILVQLAIVFFLLNP